MYACTHTFLVTFLLSHNTNKSNLREGLLCQFKVQPIMVGKLRKKEQLVTLCLQLRWKQWMMYTVHFPLFIQSGSQPGMVVQLPSACEVSGSLHSPKCLGVLKSTPHFSPLSLVSVCLFQAGNKYQSRVFLAKKLYVQNQRCEEGTYSENKGGKLVHREQNVQVLTPSLLSFFFLSSFFCGAWKENISGSNRMNHKQDREAKPMQSKGSNWVGKGFSLVSAIPTWMYAVWMLRNHCIWGKRQR